MPASIKGGAAYFALVFAAGLVLGTLRVLVVVPRLGEQTAVLLELPLMLSISWVTCAAVVRYFAVPSSIAARLAMGGVAFLLLMGAELGLSIMVFNRSLAEHISNYATAPAALGLLGQLAFAVFPLLQLISGRQGDHSSNP